jgi:hypothetical protein
MSLQDYAVNRDKFKVTPHASQFKPRYNFPCCCCINNDNDERSEPCRVCDHNSNAVKDAPPVQRLIPRNGGYCAACGKTMHTQTRILVAHSPDADHIVCMWCGADLTIAPPVQSDEDPHEKSESRAGIPPFELRGPTNH